MSLRTRRRDLVSKKTNPPIRYVILDSCIFQHFSEKSLGLKIIETLSATVQNGYGIAFSDFSFFELLDGASTKKEAERMSVIGTTKRFWVKKEVLIAAAHLGCLYHKDGISEKQQIETGDKIIGSTAFLTNSIIFTTNGRDFPRPFYNELLVVPLQYKKNDGRDVIIMGYYLEPNIPYIIEKYNERKDS